MFKLEKSLSKPITIKQTIEMMLSNNRARFDSHESHKRINDSTVVASVVPKIGDSESMHFENLGSHHCNRDLYSFYQNIQPTATDEEESNDSPIS